MKRNRLRILSPALVLAAVVVQAASRAAEPPRPPKLVPSPPPVVSAAPAVPAMLVVEKETVDLGDVVRGAKAEATFVLKNTGKVPVKILSARPG